MMGVPESDVAQYIPGLPSRLRYGIPQWVTKVRESTSVARIRTIEMILLIEFENRDLEANAYTPDSCISFGVA